VTHCRQNGSSQNDVFPIFKYFLSEFSQSKGPSVEDGNEEEPKGDYILTET